MGLFDKFFKKNVPIKEKIFEDYFTEIQADMVSICLEYVEKADCSCLIRIENTVGVW